MARPMRRPPPTLVVATAIFVAIAVLRLPLALVLLAALPVTLALHGALRRGGLP
jgi:hypothetical protein